MDIRSILSHGNKRITTECTDSIESTESIDSKPMASESIVDEPESMALESIEFNTVSTSNAASNTGEIWELPNRRYRICLSEEILNDKLAQACLYYIALPHIIICMSTA